MSLNLDHFVVARAALCRRVAQARAERLGRPIHGPEFDDESMAANDDDASDIPMVFHLIYRDAKGDLSGRCVTVRRLVHELADVRLMTFCHVRLRPRMFLASRIVELTDLATGELDEDGLGYFRRHPLLRQATADDVSVLGSEVLAIQACRDEITVLTFVAASDGYLVPEEHDEIVKHVLNRFPDEEVTEAGVRRRVASWVPDEAAFWRALNRLEAGEGDARALMRSLRRVIDADGRVDQAEAAFVVAIEERLRGAGRL